MTLVLAFDTATSATVTGVLLTDGSVIERRDDPASGERPRHAQVLLALCEQALSDAGAGWSDVSRIGAGVGPGTFTGLRIGVATARALAQATGAQVARVSTLEALARGAAEAEVEAGGSRAGGVLAVLDARRGEAFAAAFPAAGPAHEGARAVAPQALGGLASAGWLAIGDGAVRYREQLEAGGIEVPPDEDPRHRVAARPLARLAAAARPVPVATLVPEYVRLPDAELERRRGLRVIRS